MAERLVTLELRTERRMQMLEITRQVGEALRNLGLQDGTILVYTPHTTAGMTINENADPDVVRDMLSFFGRLIPSDSDFQHAEGNSDSHILASLMGSSVRVIVEGGRLRLGRWQGIYFCEFDGPRRREVWLRADTCATSV